uniref:Coat protein n=1 Tax=Cherry mottle leaf virus TaxID=131226 RepID=N0BQE6_9VIRU|nr:coat protein [Cherry mottle leaf virus]
MDMDRKVTQEDQKGKDWPRLSHDLWQVNLILNTLKLERVVTQKELRQHIRRFTGAKGTLLEKIRAYRMSARLNLTNKIQTELIAFLSQANRPLHQRSEQEKKLILRSIFANIAIQGTSDSTEFISTTVQVASSTGAEVLVAYNPRTIVGLIKLFASTNEDENISRSTFRQICEHFAEYARNGLLALKLLREYTNLYRKAPSLGGKCPELCSDFNGGLGMIDLNNEQRKVITNFNQRLLQTEIAKGEAEANMSSVSTNLCV